MVARNRSADGAGHPGSASPSATRPPPDGDGREPSDSTVQGLADTSAALPGAPIQRPKFSCSTNSRLSLVNLRFSDLNAHNTTFVDCDFSYSIFERAYFRSGKFENCTFIGCRFYDSNLRGASFYNCDLRYATFHRTLIEPKEIIAVLPLEPNLRRDSLQNLRANAVEIGDYKSQRLYVIYEIKARVDHLSKALHGSESYYREKYGTVVQKAKAGLELAGLKLSGIVWGNGERPLRMIASAAALILVLTAMNFWAVIPNVGWSETGGGLEILRYSVDRFLDAQPNAKFRGFVTVDYALIVMRYVYIGLFISVLFKWLSHR